MMSQTFYHKLNPIYDALDEGNYKLGLNLCNKLSKKHNIDVVKSLKAICLERTGKSEEAWEIVEDLRSRPQSEESVLQPMIMVYRSQKRFDIICDIYLMLSEQFPKSEDYAKQYFLALVKNKSSPGDLQKAATKLSRTFKNELYSFWNIFLVYLQSTDPTATNKDLLLTLAFRMISKVAEEEKLKRLEELYLYLEILKQKGMYKEALDVIDSPLGHLFGITSYKFNEKRLIYEHLQDYPSLLNECKKLLSSGENDWGIWKSFLQCTIELGKSQKNIFGFHYEYVKEIAGENSTFKEHLLMLMHLQKQMDKSNLQPLIFEYVEKFGFMPSVWEDISSFSDCVTDVRGFLEKARSMSDTSPAEVDPQRKALALYKLVMEQPHHGLYPETIAKDILNMYEKTTSDESLNGQVALFLVQTILNLSPKSLSNDLICITILEKITAKSENPQLRILLSRLYQNYGLWEKAVPIIKSLDMKHILLDTASFFFSSSLEFWLTNKDRFHIIKDNLRIYNSNEIETPEMISKAFKQGSYSKIVEFQDFYKKLKFSRQRAMYSSQLALIQNIDNILKAKQDPSLKLKGYIQLEEISECLTNDHRDAALRTLLKSLMSDFELSQKDEEGYLITQSILSNCLLRDDSPNDAQLETAIKLVAEFSENEVSCTGLKVLLKVTQIGLKLYRSTSLDDLNETLSDFIVVLNEANPVESTCFDMNSRINAILLCQSMFILQTLMKKYPCEFGDSKAKNAMRNVLMKWKESISSLSIEDQLALENDQYSSLKQTLSKTRLENDDSSNLKVIQSQVMKSFEEERNLLAQLIDRSL